MILNQLSEELIKRKFTYNDGVYYYDLEDGIEFIYDDKLKFLNLNIIDGSILKEWDYYFSSNNIEYYEYENDEEILYFAYDDSCNNECQEKMDYFYDLISEILN